MFRIFICTTLLCCSLFLKAQCIRKIYADFYKYDSIVKVYPDNSNLIDKPDSLVGLLTWNLDPCTKYKIFSDSKKKHCITEYYFNEDTIVAIHYYSNGKIRLIDKEVGKSRLYIYTASYYDNGQLLYSDNPNSLEARTILHYYPNGKIKKEFLLWGMGCWGTVKTWYPSGKTLSIEVFSELTEEDQKNYSMSKKTGVWKYWDENGKITKQITYDNDVLIKEENF